VAPAARPEFGDYQANGVMPAAKRLQTDPRKLAGEVAAGADLADLAEAPEVAGPGFLNIRLRPDWIARQLATCADDEGLGVPKAAVPQTVVVDYSAPNLAKEMHVGHLRSTIIGDALARVLDFLGHNVIRQNHVGDWGTQFGMLTAYMDEIAMKSHSAFEADVPIGDVEDFYRSAKQMFDTDEGFANRAREAVVKLQSGDEHYLKRWRQFLSQTVDHFQHIYDRLGVLLQRRDVRGESAYNDDLFAVVADLGEAGLLSESHGAQCVFLDEFTGKDGNTLPVIVKKSDGGYLYATTDLAAIRFRCGKGKEGGEVDWVADRILYVVDAGQGLHFRQVFAVARKAGFAPDRVRLEHVAFGVVQAAGGGKFRTREGGTVKLLDLLQEAVSRAEELVKQKNPSFTEEQRYSVANVVGIGAVKYADLAQNRKSDYVFSFEKMLSLDGNTAPYMQYAYARIRSIFRRGGEEPDGRAGGEVSLPEPAERALGLKLLQFPETVQAVAEECLPNLLCGYLYDLAVAFTGFYESCPVLKADEPVRRSRLGLCRLAARVIRRGLDLLGIQVVEQM